ncbi:hypothetical protein [Clostridium chrysemydis]|uniref:hypothetical protein n=1 Tax=Clostridium chrysemydis TaxID=2665504 RepID=UPI001883D9E6|nr:hypothetical protein [Clostridium chrysemydis]
MKKIRIFIIENIIRETLAEVLIDDIKDLDVDDMLDIVESHSKNTKEILNSFKGSKVLSVNDKSLSVFIDEMEEVYE